MRYEDETPHHDHRPEATMNPLMPATELKRIVIIGAGFGGTELARRINKKQFQVMLIDKNEYHTFHPLLFQLATAASEDKSVTFPIPELFSADNEVVFVKAEVTNVLKDQSLLETSVGIISYDQLVIATGSTINYHENPRLVQNSLSLKSVNDALKMKRKLMEQFDQMVRENTVPLPGQYNIVIVGGGAAGVEMAGAIAELKNNVLPYEYPGFNFSGVQIHLIEACGKLLKSMSKPASKKAKEYMERMDVKVWLNTTVESYRDGKVLLDDCKTIVSGIFIWAAGVKGKVIGGFEEQELTKNNRLKTDRYNRVPGYKNIYVIGDSAEMQNTDLIEPHPMIAPVAIQQAKNLARNLNFTDVSRWKKFNYRHRGTMITTGRGKAVVDFQYLRFQGKIAWYIWMFVHLSLISGMKNRMAVISYWLKSSFSYNRITRFFIKPYRKAGHGMRISLNLSSRSR